MVRRGVLLPMAYFCIINQLHSWEGRFFTEPSQGMAVRHLLVLVGMVKEGRRSDGGHLPFLTFFHKFIHNPKAFSGDFDAHFINLSIGIF